MIRFLRDKSGVTSVEYGLIAALIGIASVTIIGELGGSLASTFSSVSQAMAPPPPAKGGPAPAPAGAN
jgi:pilus assembly protein Flp/PilA